MATDLATLLQQIPLAEDGKLITRDYHNSLRAALLALAGQSTTPGKAAKSLTLVPVFTPWGGDKTPGWLPKQGVAIAGKGGADGFLPINLRDNEEIKSVIVTGFVPSDREDMVRQVTLELVQQSVVDAKANQRAVFTPSRDKVDFENSSGRFSVIFEAKFNDISLGDRLPDRDPQAKALKAEMMSTYLRIAVSDDLARTEIWGVVLALK